MIKSITTKRSKNSFVSFKIIDYSHAKSYKDKSNKKDEMLHIFSPYIHAIFRLSWIGSPIKKSCI